LIRAFGPLRLPIFQPRTKLAIDCRGANLKNYCFHRSTPLCPSEIDHQLFGRTELL
jgi:hypothetical protein